MRDKTEEEIENALHCFYFLGPHQLGNKVVYLILSHNSHSILISNKTAALETGYREMMIPRVECWYPGDLPVESITEVIKVSIRRRPKRDLVKILKKSNCGEKYRI